MKNIIINADDFAMCPLYNKAILELAQNWWITSTSVMISRISTSQRADIESLQHIRTTKGISVWLHVEFFDTRFQYHIDMQLAWFMKVFWQEPDHIDLHAHTYKQEWYPYIARKVDELWIPCRYYPELILSENKVAWAKITWTRKTVDEIMNEIELSDADTIEIIMHPWYIDERYVSGLQQQREDDIATCLKLRDVCKEKGYQIKSYLEL